MRYGLMPKTELPESKRPLTADEVTYLEREVVLYRRWQRFYTIAAIPATPIGLVAVAGSIYSLLVGDMVGVNPTQAFLVGMAVSVFGFAPLYLRFAMRDKATNIQGILDTYPRAQEDMPSETEPGEGA